MVQRYRTPVLIRKKIAIRKADWDLPENKKFGSHYTDFSVERTRSQIRVRNPAWTSFPVSYSSSGSPVRLGPVVPRWLIPDTAYWHKLKVAKTARHRA